MMKFEEFAKKVEIEVGKIAEGEAKVSIFRKNNGVQKFGLTILGEGNVSPVIYLDDFFKEYQENGNFEIIVQIIWLLFLERKHKKEVLVSNIVLWEKARENLTFKLVNYEQNRDILEKMPHRRFLDLAVVYMLMKAESMSSQEIVMVDHQLAKNWGASVEDLDKYSYRNYGKYFPEKALRLDEIIARDFGEKLPGIEIPTAPIYVLANRMNFYGASAMLFPENLEKISEKHPGDLYIFPSSVHEVLVCPDIKKDTDELRNMVREINQSEVEPEERLSDNVYRYCYESGKIEIV